MSAIAKNRTAQLTIERSGPQCLLQDLGRRGNQHLGFSPGGASDEHAYLWANKLLANAPASAALEITLGPFSCTFDGPAQFALCGAGSASLNQRPLALWQSFAVATGDRLHIAPAAAGLRCYLAVRGGFAFAPYLDSASVVPREALGPQAFSRGDRLGYTADAGRARSRRLPWRFVPDYGAELCLRLLPGYQYAQFSAAALSDLLNHSYTVGAASDRMAYRLEGNALAGAPAALLSEGVALGAVQVPPDGQPLVLLKDRQTVGGYPKLGCIAQMDCFRLSQRRAGQRVHFRLADSESCRAELRRFYDFFCRV